MRMICTAVGRPAGAGQRSFVSGPGRGVEELEHITFLRTRAHILTSNPVPPQLFEYSPGTNSSAGERKGHFVKLL